MNTSVRVVPGEAPRNPYLSSLGTMPRAGALFVVAVGVVVASGWLLGIAPFQSVLPQLVSMKMNTACGFIAAGAALWMLRGALPGSRALSVAQALSVFVIFLGALSLSQDVFGWNLGIDELLVRDPRAPGDLPPGRMAPATAVCFLSAGLSLLGVRARAGFVGWFAPVTLVFATLPILGYAYDVKALYRLGPYTAMAPSTALSFFVLSLAILAASPDRGLARFAISETAAGVVVRRLLPTIPAVLFLVGWVCVLGQRAGLYDPSFALALVVVLSVGVSLLAVSSTAASLHTADLERQRAEQEVLALNADLERRVKERTRELEGSLAQVNHLSGLLPICAWCRKVRDDHDYWQTVEQYVTSRTEARFSHGICPSCHDRILAEERELAAK
ncbi:MAG: hypothetical protein JNK60_05390 [Acidobacteria bacterium]|nr:hypothetical protein [Acidobacteriota bacterium]